MQKNHRRSSFKSLSIHLFFLFFILICGAGLAGCGQSTSSNYSRQKKFDQFLDSCFKEFATENTITLHFKLSNPSSYGIKENISPTYGSLSSDTLKKSCKRSKELLQELYTFPTSSLTKKQKLTWQIFQNYLNETIMGEKYILYSSPFGTNGLPSDIPVTLSEYRFDNEKDVKDYLSLVNQIPELFTQLIDFEEERRNADIVSPDFVIADTIDQINQFLNASEDNNLLIESFEERLDSLTSLSEDQKASYLSNNRLLVTKKVLPAYESLKADLQNYISPDISTKSQQKTDSSKTRNYKPSDTSTNSQTSNTVTGTTNIDPNSQTFDTNTENNSTENNSQNSNSSKLNSTANNKNTTSDNRTKERLCEYESGLDYYRFLLLSNVGTDMSPEECITALETQLKATAKDISSLTAKNKDLYTEYLSAVPTLSKPKEIMKNLKDDSLIDFPEIKNISYKLKNVPDALCGTSACAFYLVPPIDSKDANIIYINNNRVDSNEMFSTLAHEGYPGHLYQTNYFLSTNPSPLRTFLHCNGYDEGWGTYAQLYSYNFIEFKNVDEKTQNQLRQLYRDNDLFSLSLSSLSDLYVNYKNYDENALADYLQSFGVDNTTATTLYQYVIENPTTYLSYSIGYYELDKLEKDMKDSLGKSFKPSYFHEAVLNVGSCNFSILRQEIEKETEILRNAS